MYSNGILKKEVAGLGEEGYLQRARWVETREPEGDGRMAAGRELFIHQCYACHTVQGRNNDIARATATMSYRALVGYLAKIHETRYFMPPFAGTEAERRALAAYLVGELHGKEIGEPDVAADDRGRVLFEENCSSCHVSADLAAPFAGLGQEEIVRMLGTLNEISEEMTPFAGSAEEGQVLAGFLADLQKEEQGGQK